MLKNTSLPVPIRRKSAGVHRLETIVPTLTIIDKSPAAERGAIRSRCIKGHAAPSTVSGRPKPIKAAYMTTSKSKRYTTKNLLFLANALVQAFGLFGIACIREHMAYVFGTDASLRIARKPSLHVAIKRFVVAFLGKVNLP